MRRRWIPTPKPWHEGILLTADVSCLKALLEVRDEIVAAGHTPSAEVPTPHDLDAAIEKLLAHQLRRRGTLMSGLNATA